MTNQDNNLNQTPELSLIETISKSDLSEIGLDAGELALDLLLKEGILREIPVLKTFVSIAKGGLAIKDYIFLKKLIRFLYHLKDLSIEDRQQFTDKAKTKEQRQQLGENLLILLDRYDHLEKVQILAQLFLAYLGDVINLDKFLRFSSSVDRTYIGDLRELLKYFTGKRDEIGEHLWENLYRSGFSKLTLNMEVDNSFDLGIITTSKRLGFNLFEYTFNAEVVLFAQVILGNSFSHPTARYFLEK